MHKPTRTPTQQQADTLHEHGARCNRPIDECGACQRNIKFFQHQPLQVLGEMLQDSPAAKMRIPFLGTALDRFMGRTMHESQRGKNDCIAGGKVLRQYSAAGGTL